MADIGIEIDVLRTLFAFLCGSFLTLSGSLSQIVANNSLASPSTLGFDALGALCVILGQYLVVASPFAPSLEAASFGVFVVIFALGAWLSFRADASSKMLAMDIKFLILAGLAFNLFVGAVFAVVQFLFMALNWEFPSGLWFGNFRFYHREAVILFLAVFAGVQWWLARNAASLRLLGLGEQMALGLGVNARKAQKQSLLLSLFLTGLVISFFGVFSFLSLIVPHMLRSFSFFKSNMRRELMLGPLLGGAGLSLLDFLCFHWDYRGAEFPAGMVSSVLGAFLLILLLWRSRFKNFAKG